MFSDGLPPSFWRVMGRGPAGPLPSTSSGRFATPLDAAARVFGLDPSRCSGAASSQLCSEETRVASVPSKGLLLEEAAMQRALRESQQQRVGSKSAFLFAPVRRVRSAADEAFLFKPRRSVLLVCRKQR